MGDDKLSIIEGLEVNIEGTERTVSKESMGLSKTELYILDNQYYIMRALCEVLKNTA